jgi:hypothetical protein
VSARQYITIVGAISAPNHYLLSVYREIVCPAVRQVKRRKPADTGTPSGEPVESKAKRCYQIFKVNLNGSGLEQLTDGTFNDFDPC